jgi:hypothetical protein
MGGRTPHGFGLLIRRPAIAYLIMLMERRITRLGLKPLQKTLYAGLP